MNSFNTSSEINQVYNYWNSTPLHSLEFPQEKIDQQYFEQIDHMRWSENEFWAQKTFYDLPGNSQTKVLDAGCGVGVFTRYYAKKSFQVTAVDLTEKAVELTKLSLSLNKLTADVRQSSVESLPFADNSFDYIVSNGVIHHTPDTEKAVQEFHRVLKPGGKASIAIYYRNPLLRYPLWPLVKLSLPVFLKHLKGRENFFTVKTPEDFVKVYDGNNTPIAKVYSKKQAKELLKAFKILKMEPHYFPIRFLKGFKRTGSIHFILDHYFGCLLYLLAEKPN